jgi:predicted PurR-regulated permease PerM
LTRQIALATSSVLNFSSKPLKLVAGLGTLISAAALLWLVYVLVAFLSNRSIEGWASVMAAVLLVGGLTLLSISIIGSYIARIHDILKARPRFFIDRVSDYPKR